MYVDQFWSHFISDNFKKTVVYNIVLVRFVNLCVIFRQNLDRLSTVVLSRS